MVLGECSLVLSLQEQVPGYRHLLLGNVLHSSSVLGYQELMIDIGLDLWCWGVASCFSGGSFGCCLELDVVISSLCLGMSSDLF